jgi:pimeloyl-ACP methyl ester carboxylesterase
MPDLPYCSRMKSIAVSLGLLLLGCNTSSPPPSSGSAHVAVAEVDKSERWGASIVIGANIRDFVVRFAPGERTTATLEGVTKKPLPLSDVSLAPDRIEFTLAKPNASKETWEHYTLARTGDRASGTGTIGATKLRIEMIKLGTNEAPRSVFPRPQTPTGPFQYSVREVVVTALDGSKLAGLVTIPRKTPAPAVLLWSGSGQQDRDETMFGHRPFLILADHLTRAGFVVLRLDDRGAGSTVGSPGTLHTEIDDAARAIDFLLKQEEVDPKRVGMIGHSTGGMVAPYVALVRPVSFIVSLAGVAISGRELVPLQQQIAAKAAGITISPEQVALQKALGEAALEGPDKIKKVLREVVGAQMTKLSRRKPTQEEVDAAIAEPLAQATHPWTISYFTIDPREAWKKLSIPVLLVVGELDTQVPADVTIAALESSHAQPSAVTSWKLPGLNHLFQNARTGHIDEYVEITESFDAKTLDIITTWLGATVERSP